MAIAKAIQGGGREGGRGRWKLVRRVRSWEEREGKGTKRRCRGGRWWKAGRGKGKEW